MAHQLKSASRFAVVFVRPANSVVFTIWDIGFRLGLQGSELLL